MHVKVLAGRLEKSFVLSIQCYLLAFIFFSKYNKIVAAPTPDPLFVSVPPRPQRVLHSDAYIK